MTRCDEVPGDAHMSSSVTPVVAEELNEQHKQSRARSQETDPGASVDLSLTTAAAEDSKLLELINNYYKDKTYII